jgi:hypothetical protein
MERVFPILQFLTGEAPGRTVTIQVKVAIWAAHQPIKNEPGVEFPTHK